MRREAGRLGLFELLIRIGLLDCFDADGDAVVARVDLSVGPVGRGGTVVGGVLEREGVGVLVHVAVGGTANVVTRVEGDEEGAGEGRCQRAARMKRNNVRLLGINCAWEKGGNVSPLERFLKDHDAYSDQLEGMLQVRTRIRKSSRERRTHQEEEHVNESVGPRIDLDKERNISRRCHTYSRS